MKRTKTVGDWRWSGSAVGMACGKRPLSLGCVPALLAALVVPVHAQSGPGTALSFDGTSQVVQVGSSNVPPPWTAEFWVNRQDAPGISAILLYGTSSALKLEQYNGTRKVGFTQYGVADYAFNYIVPSNTWVHLAFVSTTTNTTLYVNGQFLGSTNNVIPLPLGQIAGDTTLSHGANYMKGLLDEIRVWRAALSQTQIQSNMNRSLLLPESDLIAYWKFDENGGANASDSSGSGHTGTLVNGPTWVASGVPFLPTVTTEPAAAISTNTATLTGTVNPNGIFAYAWFQWGLNTNYGSNTFLTTVGSGTNTLLVQSSVSGLSIGTTYHYRTIGSNFFGGVVGSDQTFIAGPQSQNTWVSPFSGKWETPQNWLAGSPSTDQWGTFITNATPRTVTLDSTTAIAYSNTLAVTSLTVGPGTGTNVDTLALVNVGLNQPLTVLNDFDLAPGGALTLSNSAFEAAVFGDLYVDGSVVANNSLLVLSNTDSTTHTWLGQNGPTHLATTNSLFGTGFLVLGDAFNADATFVNSTVQVGSLLSVGRTAPNTGSLTVLGGQFNANNPRPFNSPNIIGNTGVGQVTVSNAVAQFYDTIIGNLGPGWVTLAGSNVSTMGQTWLGYGNGGGSGTLLVSGGQVSVPEVQVGVAGTGTVMVAGGTLQVSGTMYLANQPVPNSVGSVVVTGGSLLHNNGTMVVGSYGRGQVSISGGTVQASGMLLGNAGTGNMSMSGGTCVVTNSLLVGNPYSAPSSIILSGGTLNVTNGTQTALLNLVKGPMVIAGGTAVVDTLSVTSLTSQLSLNSGSLTVNSTTTYSNQALVVGSGATSATLNLQGGTHAFPAGLTVAAGSTLNVGCARIDGPVINYGTINDICSGGLVVFNSAFTNNAHVVAGAGQTYEFWGPVVNNGVLGGVDGGAFHFHGPLMNNGAISNALSTPSVAWQPWSEVPTNMTTDVPVACTIFQNDLFLFAKRDYDQRIFENTFDGTNWSLWTEVPGSGITDTALAAAAYDGNLHLFGKGINDRQLYDNIFDGTNWSGWVALPGGAQTYAAPAALSYGGYLYLFRVYGSGSNAYSAGDPLFFDRLSQAGWLGWLPLSTNLLTTVSAGVAKQDKTLYLFGVGYSGSTFARVYVTVLNGLTWSGISEVPGNEFTLNPICAVSHSGQLNVFARAAADNLLYSSRFDGSTWSGWGSVPEGGPSSLTVAGCDFRYGLRLFAVRSDHHIYMTTGALGPAPPDCVGLSIARVSPGALLSWDGVGTLESAPTPIGPWSNLVGATSPFSAQDPPASDFFRVLRYRGLYPGFKQGACVDEVPGLFNVSQSPLLSGNWLAYQPPAGLDGDDIDEPELFTNMVSYASDVPFSLAPGDTRELTITVPAGVTIFGSADSYGSSQPLALTILSGGNVLAVGTQSTVDYHWGSVRSQVAVSQAGSITARLFNPGTSTVTVKFSLTSNVLPL